MTTNFGTDLYSVDDLDETQEVSGLALIAQDALWRLQTPRAMGILAEDAPTYGMDILEAIGSVETESDVASLPSQLEAELRGDERIHTAAATVIRTLLDGGAARFDISIECTTAEGPFDLVGSVIDGTVNLAIKLLPGAIDQ